MEPPTTHDHEARPWRATFTTVGALAPMVVHSQGGGGGVIHRIEARVASLGGDCHGWVMTLEIPAGCRELLASQERVIGRSQGAKFGLSPYSMRYRVRAADWQRMQRGVYATFSGEVTREAQLWAALVRAGPAAMLSHQTAAELYGLLKQPSSMIHLTVPATANPARHGKIPGVVVHRSRIIETTRHPVLLPPRTRLEHTVLDLIADMDDRADRYDLICRAIGSRLTTAARLRQTLDNRSRFPERREAESALGDAGQGATSNLERWYLRGVERRHGFPVAARQARIKVGGRSIYLDNLYEEYVTGETLSSRRSSPCASGTWTCIRRRRSAGPRLRWPAFSATGGRGSECAVGWRAAPFSAGTDGLSWGWIAARWRRAEGRCRGGI
jgi:hypothetical protein